MSLKYNDVALNSNFPGEIDTPTYVTDLDAATLPKAKHYQDLLDLENYEEAESYLNSEENEDLRRCLSSAKLLNEMQDRILAAQITINSRDVKQETIMQAEEPAYIDQNTGKYWIKESGEDTHGDKYGNAHIRTGENLEDSAYVGLKVEPGTRKNNSNIGAGSFVVGNNCEASGENSFAVGKNIVAKGENQTVVGKFNEEDAEDKYAFIVGGGTSDSERDNLMCVDWDGNVKYKGSIISNNDITLTNGVSLSGLDSSIKLLEQTLIDKIYPVGSIYMSATNVSPSVFLGGTWEPWGAGKVPVGVNANEEEFNTVEKTGGAKTHTLSTSQIPSHTHTIGAHSHGLNSHTHSVGKHNHSIPALSGTAASGGAHKHNFSHDILLNAAFQYDTQGHDNWLYTDYEYTSERVKNFTIETSGTHTHTVTTTASTTGDKAAFNTGSASGNTANSNSFDSGATGLSASHNNLQPYITCYMWKRTA